jgi:hypothetical protein
MLSLIQRQFHNFILLRLKFNTKCIKIFKHLIQLMKPEKQT